MELEELIVEIVIGLFLLFTSYQIGIKENITLLHGYHYTQLCKFCSNGTPILKLAVHPF